MVGFKPPTLHQEALFLYRKAVRAAHTYPARPNRQGRTLREVLLVSGRSQFEANRNETEPAKIRALLTDGKKQIDAVARLKEETHKKEFPITREMEFPAIVYNADAYLSTKIQQAKLKKKGSFWSRLFGAKTVPKEPKFRTTTPKAPPA
ncbi:hypothetical protein PROFUN_03554 [Planoprotostelium fungivorum]|uniref:Complex 1 LYR protein domain-containing protein n=1 Tax=Planoprotostelium fungivorum TaxID=1890364 RepID=A0A2P6MSF2_9EUKA|nr:hypothetical protein PROFUN_03554 [Planoprotostelium fungivorum]